MATLTVYPDPSAGSTTISGNVQRHSVDETFSNIRTGAGVTVDYNELRADLQSTLISNQYQLLHRSIMTFDTSALTVGATISSAVLSLWGIAQASENGETDLHVVAAGPASNNALVAADYSTMGSTGFGSLVYGSFVAGAYNDITLNSDGRAAISKNGITKLGLVLAWDLAASFSGIWASQGATRFRLNSSLTFAGTTRDPKLVITYTVPTEPEDVIDASNTTPIEIKTAATHGLLSGRFVRLVGVGGNTAANGVRSLSFTQKTISSASGTTITTSSAHGWSTGQVVVINGVRGVNGQRTITVTGASTFTTSETATAAADADAYVYAANYFLLGGSAGNGAFTGGGTVTDPLNFQVLEGWVRRRTNTVIEDRLTTPVFIDWANWAIASIVPRISYNDYIATSSLGTGTSFDLSALKLRGIVKIVDATNGLIVPINPTGFERVQLLSSMYSNSAFWTQHGETLKVFYGSGLTGGAVTLYYDKVPDSVLEVEDGFDIDDSYFHLILDKVCNQVEDWKRFNNWKAS